MAVRTAVASLGTVNNDNGFSVILHQFSNDSDHDVTSLLSIVTSESETIIDGSISSLFNAFPEVGLIAVPTCNSSFAISSDSNSICFDGNYYFDAENFLYHSGYGDLFDLKGSCSSSVSLASLNGNGCEFIDGASVTVSGRDTVYIVDRSYMGLLSDNSYTAVYDLSSSEGHKLTAPEALLTKYTPSA